MRTVQAKWYHEGRQGEAPRVIVIHCTVSPEMGTGAEAVAAYFARGERKASAHRVADNNSTVICVADSDTAYAAAGANRDGLHLELVGQPTQSSDEWLDEYSRAELFQAGLTVREWSRDYGIPLRWLSVAEVRDGQTKGLCTHADVSAAFPAVSTGHWDPGPGFPKADALDIWTPQDEPPPDPITQPSRKARSMLLKTSKGSIIHLIDGRMILVADGTDGIDAAELTQVANIQNGLPEEAKEPVPISGAYYNRLVEAFGEVVR